MNKSIFVLLSIVVLAIAAVLVWGQFGVSDVSEEQEVTAEPSSTSEKEMVSDVDENNDTTKKEVILTESGTTMTIPREWRVVEERYVLDEDGRLAMTFNAPVREIGRPVTKMYERGEIDAGVGTLDLYAEEYENAGSVLYMWSPETEGQEWFEQSFEIYVPLQTSLYARTAEEQQAGGGLPTRYASYEEFVNDRDVIENIIRSIE